jgi:signal transduction histidine kinase
MIIPVEKKKREGTIIEKILAIFVLLTVIPLGFVFVLLIGAYQEIVTLYVSAENLQAFQKQILTLTVFILFFVVVLTIFSALWISRIFLKPLRRIVEGIKKVSDGDLTVEVGAETADEFGEMADFFNKMVKRLKESKERDETISAMKSEFITVAAHQLRTPLSAVKWTMKLILDGDVGAIPDEQRIVLAKGYEANERMIALVGDLLNVARIEEGKFGYVFAKEDIVVLVKKSVGEFMLKAAERELKLIFEQPEFDSLKITMDAGRIEMVLGNLIENAIKYSLPKGFVAVILKKEGDYVVISVSDTGVGIPKEAHYGMFHKFFRAPNVVRLQTEGSGLGIFMAKNIVERHGGKIWFTSEDNKGTTFTFTLPIVEDLMPHNEKVEEQRDNLPL